MKILIKRLLAFLGSIIVIAMAASLTIVLHIYKFLTKTFLGRNSKSSAENQNTSGQIDTIEGQFDSDDPFGAPQVKRGRAKEAMKTSNLTVDDVKAS